MFRVGTSSGIFEIIVNFKVPTYIVFLFVYIPNFYNL